MPAGRGVNNVLSECGRGWAQELPGRQHLVAGLIDRPFFSMGGEQEHGMDNEARGYCSVLMVVKDAAARVTNRR